MNLRPDELTFLQSMIDRLQSGASLHDIEIPYDPVWSGDTRYDKAVVGHFYMPWLHHPDFLELYGKAERIETGAYQGMAVAPRAYVILKAAEAALGLPSGDFVECGVYKGGTALLAGEVILRGGAPYPTLHLFDTFAGIPDEGLNEAEKASGKAHALDDVSLPLTQHNLAAYQAFTAFYPGMIPATLQVLPQPLAVRYLHIDLNTAQAHLDCLNFWWPQLLDGAIVVFDDYGWPAYAAVREAIDQWFGEQGLPLPMPLQTGQGWYVHRPAARRLLDF